MAVLLLSLWGCEKEEFGNTTETEQTEQTSGPEVTYLRGHDARREIKHLKTVYRESGGRNGGVVLDSAFFKWGYIDKNRVMRLTIRDDSLRTRTVNTTYRVRRYDEAPDNTFINLVLSENEYRTTLTLYGYVMSPEFAHLYHHEGYPLTDFDGVALTMKLDLGDDIKNCPNDIVAIKNWRDAQGHPEDTTLPPEYTSPPQGGPGNFPGFLNDIAHSHGGGGGPTGGGSGDHVPLDLSFVADGFHWAGDVLGDIGQGFSDAWHWLKRWTHGQKDCKGPGIMAPSGGETGNPSLELGGDGPGLVLIEEDHYDWDHPENPYPDPSFLTGDYCHNLAVGALSELFSKNFIAESLSPDDSHQFSVKDVELMYNHPEFLFPGMQFLETERFSHEAKLYFYEGFQVFKNNHMHGITIHYQGFFINFYTEFDINATEYNWLVNDATKEQLDAIDDFYEENEDNQENEDLMISLIDYLMDDNHPSVDVGKYLNLISNIRDNPNYLLDHYSVGQPSGDYEDWQELVQYQFPTSVIQKIEDLKQNNNEDWDLQLIEGATGANVNMDYFAVKISQLPKKPIWMDPNQNRFTSEEFLNFVRKNINTFTKDDNGDPLSTFSPSTATGPNYNEAAIWNSTDPSTAVVHIDIPLPGPLTNDGSVICSKYNSSEWYFTILQTPFLDGEDYDGTHPVSGNRAFGIKENPDGSYTLYTRGVDRVRYRIAEIIGNYLFDDAFANADALWTAFQNRLVEYITDPLIGHGQAQVLTPITHRVDFEAIRNDLMGN